MDVKKILNVITPSGVPVGLGGCKNDNTSFPCCEYNITVFDNKDNLPDDILEIDNEFVKVHHASLNETRSGVLIHYDTFHILSDDSWELRMLQAKVKQIRHRIYYDQAKNCLLDSLFCIARVTDGLKTNDPFVGCWQKCAAFCLAEAILLINQKPISPTHMLDALRKLSKSRINENLAIISECIGIERATPSLLSRISKSTAGFSDMVEQNRNSELINRKYRYLSDNSLVTDCYFYLGFMNKSNFMKIKNTLHRRPDVIHILKVALDLDNDTSKIEHHAGVLREATNRLLGELKQNSRSIKPSTV